MKATPRQRDVLRVVHAFHVEYGYAPEVREIGEVLGLTSPSTIHRHLVNLRGMGLVDWVDNSPRTLHLTDKGQNTLVLDYLNQ